MSASLKESVPPTGIDVRFDDEPVGYSQRDQDFVELLNTAGLARELDEQALATIAAALPDGAIDARRMDLLEHYYRGDDDPTIARRRRESDRFFAHHDHFEVNAHEIVSSLAALSHELERVELQRIGGRTGPLVLRAGEHFTAIADEAEDGEEAGTVAVRALVRAMNALLAKAGVERRLVPLIPDDNRELYVGVCEEGAMTLLQGGCTEISAVQALREFASW